MVKIAEAQGVSASTFFDSVSALRDVPSPVDDLQTEGADRLLRAYSRVSDFEARKALVQIAKSLAAQSESQSTSARAGARPRLKRRRLQDHFVSPAVTAELNIHMAEQKWACAHRPKMNRGR